MTDADNKPADTAMRTRATALARDHARAGRTQDALAIYRDALRADPGWVDGWHATAMLFHHQGALDSAISAYRAVLKRRPDDAVALGNLGVAYAALGQTTEARMALEKSLALDPANATNSNNLGHLLYRLGDYERAEKWLKETVRLKSDFALAWSNLGDLYRIQGRWTDSVRCYRAALAHAPENGAFLSNLVYSLRTLCDWDDIAAAESRLLERVRAAVNAGKPPPIDPFVACFIAMPGPLFRAIMAGHAKPRSDSARARRLDDRFSAQARRTGRIRIGYLSAAFRNHATGHLASSLFGLHDRDLFEIHGYGVTPSDGSALRREIENGMDMFKDMTGMADHAVAEVVARDRIDILIDLDGYIQGNRGGILAQRPAPVQATYLGFPGTSGAPYIDYLIADPVVAPAAAEADFSEALIRLPHCYQFNQHHRYGVPAKLDRRAFGVPETGPVLCNFNVSRKIDPGSFALWMRILRRAPEALLWILVDDEDTMANLRRQAEMADVDAGRLIKAERLSIEAHLARCAVADIFLDSLIYSAHTTGTDALWAGLPVVTLPGRSFASRVGASLVKAAGLSDLVADSEAAYEEIVVALIAEPDRLAATKARLAANRATAPLFDSRRFVRHLEAAFLAIHHHALGGASPASIDMPPLYPPSEGFDRPNGRSDQDRSER